MWLNLTVNVVLTDKMWYNEREDWNRTIKTGGLGMKIYDISQDVFGCEVYPGDPVPEKKIVASMEKGELYNLTAFSMCAHNGTHIDAPFHFLKDGKTVDEIPLNKMIGFCFVVAL